MVAPKVSFIHAPSIYDFRHRPAFYGPIADLIPSSPIFDMYPIGFISLGSLLERNGISTGIYNLAAMMLRNRGFNVEEFIRRLRSQVFCIDLHWLPHCQGALAIAEMIRNAHPRSYIVFGGYSSTYFHQELVRDCPVDFVVKGDSTEEAFLSLIKALVSGSEFAEITSITFKNGEKIISNPCQPPPTELSDDVVDYEYPLRLATRALKLKHVLPFASWLDYPITMALSCRGCTMDCVTCGGSRSAGQLLSAREEPSFVSPAGLARQIFTIARYFRGPIFVVGDLNQAGPDYVEEFFHCMRSFDRDNPIMFEFFSPPPPLFFAKARKVFRSVFYELSIDSHDERVRKRVGKNYTNDEVYEVVQRALNSGAKRFDLYFLVGLPEQDVAAVMGDADFCRSLYERIGWDPRLAVFSSAVAPFVDPASRAFERPEENGYVLKRKSLMEHVMAMLEPSWNRMLNYQTKWMSSNEIALSTYALSKELNLLRAKAGAMSEETALALNKRIDASMDLMRRIDEVCELYNGSERENRLRELLENAGKLNNALIVAGSDLKMAYRMPKFRYLNIAGYLFFGRWLKTRRKATA